MPAIPPDRARRKAKHAPPPIALPMPSPAATPFYPANPQPISTSSSPTCKTSGTRNRKPSRSKLSYLPIIGGACSATRSASAAPITRQSRRFVNSSNLRLRTKHEMSIRTQFRSILHLQPRRRSRVTSHLQISHALRHARKIHRAFPILQFATQFLIAHRRRGVLTQPKRRHFNGRGRRRLREQFEADRSSRHQSADR